MKEPGLLPIEHQRPRTRTKDTAHMAFTAEDYIAFKLQEAGFLVTKPKFDKDGTDLIILLSVNTGAKFGNVQCKGRSLTNAPRAPISIPCEYVKDSFFLFVYVNYNPCENLYLFFADDIKKWKVSRRGQYVKNISRRSIDNGSMRDYLFRQNKAEKISEIIRKTTSELEREMYQVMRMGTDLIKKHKEARLLGELVHKMRLLDKEEELAKKDLKEAYTRLRNLAKEIVETAPTRLIDKIQELKKGAWPEEYVLSEVLKDDSIDLDKDTIWLIILYLYDSMEGKF